MKLAKIILGLVLLLGLLVFWNLSWDIPVEELREKYTNETSQFREVQGMQVHYREEGKGMPVVLLHGTAASLHTWEEWTKTLRKSYRVISLDLPAFGLTGPNAQHDYRLATYTDFLRAFLADLQIDSCYLVGNSLGGSIAWSYAAAEPAQVKKLVLLDPAGFLREGSTPLVFKLANTPVVNQIMRYLTPKAFIAKNLREVYYDDSKVSPALIDRYYEMALRQGNRDAFIARAQLQRLDQTEQLKTIEAPTLIIWGKEDLWIPVEQADLFLAELPNAELVVMEDTGHVPMEERPEESLAPVLRFFKE